MKNVLRVLKRDFSRLIHAPAALVVVIALIILPSLYTWMNVYAFWSPYDNTGQLRVCVVNEDKGAESDITGKINIGQQLVDQLADNDQLNWTFTDEDTALEEVRAGKSYAAFVIPEDFSHDITTLFTDDFHQPQLLYYVNEKRNAVSPKITDTGANTLEETINATFVSTVSGVVAQTIDEKAHQANEKLESTQNTAVQNLSNAQTTLQDVSTSIDELSKAASDASEKTKTAKSKLTKVKTDIAAAADTLKKTEKLIEASQNALGPFTANLSATLNSTYLLGSKVATQANQSISKAATSISNARPHVASANKYGKETVADLKKASSSIRETVASLPESTDEQKKLKEFLNKELDSLDAQITMLETAVNDGETVYNDLDTAAQSIAAASDKVNTAVQGTLVQADDYRVSLDEKTLPAINNGLTKLGTSAGKLSGTIKNQTQLVDQTELVLDQLGTTLASITSALGEANGLIGGLDSDLELIKSDVASLSISSQLKDLFGDELDSDKIADFMLSPTQLETIPLYTISSYGTAMSALFMNMTLWIGVFMLLIILRQEVDGEGIKNLSVRQRYLGKWFFLAPMAAMQAIVCCTGLLLMGVVPSSTPLFFLTAVIASLTYLSIQFALSITMQHVGKGLCVVLIFLQIPGATGLYPIEMMPQFFQTVHFFLPFTYGINALRETLAGFYQWQWIECIGVLLLFFALFMLLGLFARSLFTNVNRMFASELKKSGIIAVEDVELPQRRYRVDRLTKALSDRIDLNDELQTTVRKFKHWYPILVHRIPAASLIVPIALTAICMLIGFNKVVILTVWLGWLLTLMLWLIGVEYFRDRLEHELALSSKSDGELVSLFGTHKRTR